MDNPAIDKCPTISTGNQKDLSLENFAYTGKDCNREAKEKRQC